MSLFQKPNVEINAPSTVRKKATGPTVTMPPTAKPPVVKNNTKNPRNATNKAIKPCIPIHANATKPKLEDTRMATMNA